MRKLWLGVGIVLGLLFAAEAAYRTQAALRRYLGSWRAAALPANPEAREPWYRPLMAEMDSTTFSWGPFVYYRRQPFRGRYLNIDSLGLRATLSLRKSPGTPREVFLFGGSPLWGEGLRDSRTIPSRLAVELGSRGLSGVAITNFGEEGYVFTQDLVELLLQLRAGARPAAVVFYGGYNDIEAAMDNGRAGGTKVERDAIRDLQQVRPLFTWRADLRAEAGVALRLVRIAVSRSQILSRLLPGAGLSATPPLDSLAGDITATYLRTVEVVEALAAHYGFAPFYVWMPILDGTKAEQSAYERAIAAAIERDPRKREFAELHRLVTRRIESAMRGVAAGRFAQPSRMFAADSETVYLDDEGHLTESAATRIAAELAVWILPVLSGRAPRPQAASTVRSDR